MLMQLDEPLTVLAIAISLLVAIVLHSMVQAYAAKALLGDRQALALGRGRPDPRRHFEPFGVVAMLIAGIGWPKPVPIPEPRFRGARNRYLLAVVSGALANLFLAFACVLLFLVVDPVSGDGVELVSGSFGRILLAEMCVVNAAVGVLTLIPLPPLDGARVLWVYAPRTPGWQKARYHLEEQNIGMALCVVLILPVFGGEGLLSRLVFSITAALLDGMQALVGL